MGVGRKDVAMCEIYARMHFQTLRVHATLHNASGGLERLRLRVSVNRRELWAGLKAPTDFNVETSVLKRWVPKDTGLK